MSGERVGTDPQSGAARDIDGAGCHRLVMPNRLSELRRVSEWVHSFALERGLTRELVYALELSMNEVLTNIISYAYRDDMPHQIVVELFAQPERIRVEIEDDGVPFNPLGLLMEEAPQSLEKSRSTGRGIPLIRNLMDQVDYVRRGGNNVLTIIMQIKPAQDRSVN